MKIFIQIVFLYNTIGKIFDSKTARKLSVLLDENCLKLQKLKILFTALIIFFSHVGRYIEGKSRRLIGGILFSEFFDWRITIYSAKEKFKGIICQQWKEGWS